MVKPLPPEGTKERAQLQAARAAERIAEKQKPRKKIRYALGGNADVAYFNSTTNPGATGPWSESEDNPMSTTFRPLTERSERSKARWWALHGKKGARPAHGEYDAKPL